MKRRTCLAESNLGWLIDRTKPHWRQQVLLCSLLLGVDLLTFVDPLVLKFLLDRVLPTFTYQLLISTCGLLLAASLTRAQLEGFAEVTSAAMDSDLIRELRVSALRHITLLDDDFHQSTSNGRKLFYFENVIPEIVRLGADALHSLIGISMMFVIAFLLLIRLDRHLTLIVLPLAFLAPVLRFSFKARLRGLAERSEELKQRSYSRRLTLPSKCSFSEQRPAKKSSLSRAG